MTYFSVLFRFIGPPLLVLTIVTLSDLGRARRYPTGFRTWSPWGVLLAHVAIALIYTTPWDNYLVATRVWWYEPTLVTGVTLGWVPIEEYTFFVVQTLLTGLWLLALLRRSSPPSALFRVTAGWRIASAGVAVGLCLAWLVLLLSGWARGRYMALLLVWFLPPIIGQLAFGADILWHHRRVVLAGLIPPFLYLCLVDALAIRSGTWTINPANTLGLDLAQILPLEEITFFLVTNVVIVFGMVLMLARESHVRAKTRIGREAIRSSQ
jgi:lycopene cyclase domain-containing protein